MDFLLNSKISPMNSRKIASAPIGLCSSTKGMKYERRGLDLDYLLKNSQCLYVFQTLLLPINVM